MSGNLLITGARAVLPDRVLPSAWVRVAQGKIVAISEEPLESLADDEIVVAEGRWLMPGLIDLHCDGIEKEVQPRPGVMVPYELALSELDRKLALSGVTTMYHGISFGAGEGVRSNAVAAELARSIARFARGRTLVNHRVHLRFELSNFEALDLVAELLEERTATLLSFMDHTPGQGQYRNPERFKHYMLKTYSMGEAEIDAVVRAKVEGRGRVTEARLNELAGLALGLGVPIAAHDLDSREAVEQAAALGATIVEFPMSLDVARYVTSRGLRTCVGAPNVLLGRSQDGNLSAREAISANAASLICSDYHPSSVLQAVFTVADLSLAPLHDALAMATHHPAHAVGLGGLKGALQVGADADLLLVSERNGHPGVDTTIVSGEVVLTAAARNPAAAT